MIFGMPRAMCAGTNQATANDEAFWFFLLYSRVEFKGKVQHCSKVYVNSLKC